MDAGLVIFLSIMSLLLVFAVFSNSLVIYCVIRIKKLRTVTNVFICNLSVSDILLAGVVLPQRLHDVYHHMNNYIEGEVLCKEVNFSLIFVISSSVYTLVFVSFERYRAIIDSQESRMTNKKLTIVIVIIWALALAISIPTLLEYSVQEFYKVIENETVLFVSCGSEKTQKLGLSNAVFVFIISYVIPVILMLKNYTQVALFVWEKGKRIEDSSTARGTNVSSFHLLQHRLKLVKLLVIVAMTFAMSWLPFYIMLIYAKATGNDASENAAGFANLIQIALATFSTAYNFILYIIFNPSFKQAIGGVLKCTKTSEIQEQQGTHSPTRQKPPKKEGTAGGKSGIFTVTPDNPALDFKS